MCKLEKAVGFAIGADQRCVDRGNGLGEAHARDALYGDWNRDDLALVEFQFAHCLFVGRGLGEDSE